MRQVARSFKGISHSIDYEENVEADCVMLGISELDWLYQHMKRGTFSEKCWKKLRYICQLKGVRKLRTKTGCKNDHFSEGAF